MSLADIRALTFDVFGTVVDWRSGVARAAEEILAPKGYAIDWPAFADAWRALYYPALAAVNEGRKPLVPLDTLHRETLDELLPGFGVTGLSEAELTDLAHGWRRLDPWTDSVSGMMHLRTRFILAALSNANVALMIEMSRRGDLPWDALLGGDVARGFKTSPAVYDTAVAMLGLEPHQVMMVAAHPRDLRAAAGRGLRTAYVHRALEYGPGAEKPWPDKGEFDIAVDSLGELADRLGA